MKGSCKRGNLIFHSCVVETLIVGVIDEKAMKFERSVQMPAKAGRRCKNEFKGYLKQNRLVPHCTIIYSKVIVMAIMYEYVLFVGGTKKPPHRITLTMLKWAPFTTMIRIPPLIYQQSDLL